MTEHPILFSAPMVRAILDGRKTQTRRVVKDYPKTFPGWWKGLHWVSADHFIKGALRYYCPYGHTGDHLWVKETWAHDPDVKQSEAILYRATDSGWDDNDTGLCWRPSIHMSRLASRIALEIIAVRVERVQEITEADARTEGVGFVQTHVRDADGNCTEEDSYVECFASLWDELNAKRGYSWGSNPWVWVIEFRKIKS